MLAMRDEGVREIPLKKSLICRNRYEKGLKIYDAELSSWNECLHRYDQYPDLEISQHQSINGAISKLYKT